MSEPPRQNASPSSSEKSSTSSSPNASSTAKAAEAAPRQNPALRMLGIPNWKPKLPSRNWLIFLTITTSFTCAILYDRHYKRKSQEKWARVVSHLQKDPLSTKQMPRRLTVYLAAPPGDGLRIAREHFHEYVRPVLEKGGVDWDVVEGRREGDVRAGTAERIRRKRRKAEGVVLDEADLEQWGKEEANKEDAIESVRELNGVKEYEGIGGDIVIGRHVWKEYVRGLHEGWLGPLKRPKEEGGDESQPSTTDQSAIGGEPWQLSSTPESTSTPLSDPIDNLSGSPSTTQTDDAPPTVQPPGSAPDESEPSDSESESESESKPKKPTPPPPYLPPSAYNSSPLPPTLPSTLGPYALIPHPHILGFLNTRIRLGRYLTRRYLADQIGREVAAAVFASSRPFQNSSLSSSASEPWSSTSAADHGSGEGAGVGAEGEQSEQAKSLDWEERDWPKSVRKEWEKRWGEDEEKGERRAESMWLDGVVLDERIAERMRRFVLDAEEEDRIRKIGKGEG
ncbi:hypothetical protein EV356DRAFT_566839 [Viridothelium virens]|uniref:Mitochondrial import inner membrane translocase subunit TIM54 n=1 Tax=Viridothelium virens TaxID=1048519 RepID=A0A6A6HA84_VIRVR|nr:hypothetical protein EV356DRAFT_566839 [Viridothelium virens]